MGLDGKNPALQTPNNCCPLTVLLKKTSTYSSVTKQTENTLKAIII